MKIAFVLGTGVDDIDFMNVNSLLDKCKSYMPIEIHHLGGSAPIPKAVLKYAH